MIYQEFKKNVKITIQTWIGSSAKVTIQEIIKNNGTYYDGITIISEQMNVSPTVQLSSYFEQYQEDRSLDAICHDILKKSGFTDKKDSEGL